MIHSVELKKKLEVMGRLLAEEIHDIELKLDAHHGVGRELEKRLTISKKELDDLNKDIAKLES